MNDRGSLFSDQPAGDERVYLIFHEDGPIRLTETELCNGYMRLRDALRQIANQTEGDVAATCVALAKEQLR